MPNWCSNIATFSGQQQNLDRLFNAIREAIAREEQTREGQKIHSSEIKEGYFFEMYFDGSSLYYETRWSPNVEDVAELCKEFGVSAEVEFSEFGDDLFGTAFCYQDGTYTIEYVDPSFLDLIKYDDYDGVYLCNGCIYQSKDEAIEMEYYKWKEKNLF